MAEDIKEENEENMETSDGLIPEETEETNSETQEDTVTENMSNDFSEQEMENTEELDSEDTPVQKKQNKLQKILVIVAGVLGGILLIGIILYFFGFFDPEEQPKPQVTMESMDINQTKEPEKYIFNSKDINIDRLNGKLRILTKYEIIGTEEEEKLKELEKNSKLSTDQINKLLNNVQKEEKIEEKPKEEKKVEVKNPYDLLKFIQIGTNGTLLSSIENEIQKYKVKISSCKDRSQEFSLIGPFSSNKELNEAFRTIFNITPNATKKDLARLEFNRICN